MIGDVAPIQNFTPTPRLFDDAQIESFRKLADSVHVYGAKLESQYSLHPEYDCETMMRLFAEGEDGRSPDKAAPRYDALCG